MCLGVPAVFSKLSNLVLFSEMLPTLLVAIHSKAPALIK